MDIPGPGLQVVVEITSQVAGVESREGERRAPPVHVQKEALTRYLQSLATACCLLSQDFRLYAVLGSSQAMKQEQRNRVFRDFWGQQEKDTRAMGFWEAQTYSRTKRVSKLGFGKSTAF